MKIDEVTLEHLRCNEFRENGRNMFINFNRRSEPFIRVTHYNKTNTFNFSKKGLKQAKLFFNDVEER